MLQIEMMDSLCKFSIGDLVVLKGSHEVAKRRNGSGKHIRSLSAQPMTVVERMVQQCYGGIQIRYLLRTHHVASEYASLDVLFGTETVNLVEVELMPAPELPAETEVL